MKKLITMASVLASVANVWEWDDTIGHPDLTEHAVKDTGYFDDDILETILVLNGEALKVKEWFRRGAEQEDDGAKYQFFTGTARSINHFHDPTEATLEDAGLRGGRRGPAMDIAPTQV